MATDRINSRKKGATNERKAAKLLSKWAGVKFARTPSSGGLNWQSTHAKGDIVCTEEGFYFPFCVEVKAHKDIDMIKMAQSNPSSKIINFWQQCKGDALAANKIPLLMMRQNGMPAEEWLIVMRTQDMKKLLKAPRLKAKYPVWDILSSHKYGWSLFSSEYLLENEYEEVHKKSLKLLGR